MFKIILIVKLVLFLYNISSVWSDELGGIKNKITKHGRMGKF